VEAPHPVAKGEQAVVAQREKGSPESGEHRELVVGPLDGGERIPERQDLLAGVEGAAAHHHVRDAPPLQGPHVGTGQVAAEAGEAAEEQADVARLQRNPRVALAIVHGPAALPDQPLEQRSHRVGVARLDLAQGDA
jgi:hypothetical protein